MSADILYISFDGVTQPLPFSQVVRVVAALGAHGLRYHLLSVERPADLAVRESVATVEATLRGHNVNWTYVTAPSMGTPRLAANVVSRALACALKTIKRERIKLVHARGYQSALVAYLIKKIAGVPFVFDTRGCWIEERVGPRQWFANPGAYAGGKFAEQKLFRAARAIVTLTGVQATDVRSALFGRDDLLVEVIPTCADYEEFHLRSSRPHKPTTGTAVPEQIRRRLADRNVIAMVGSINGTYCIRESIELAKLATELDPRAHLLVLSAQGREYENALAAVGFPRERSTISSAQHWAMAEWLQWVDWGLLLVPETLANRGKMPTKLAEFFAAGVRPVFLGCNSDASRWVDRAGSGVVLHSADAAERRRAAGAIAEAHIEFSRLQFAREVTEPHFGLQSGIDRYASLLERCLTSPDDGRAAPSNQLGRSKPIASNP